MFNYQKMSHQWCYWECCKATLCTKHFDWHCIEHLTLKEKIQRWIWIFDDGFAYRIPIISTLWVWYYRIKYKY